VLNLAHILGITTIAEGVETEKEFFFCKETGCDYVQGYFIQKPTVNLDEIYENYEHITEINMQNKRQITYDHKLLQDQLEYVEPVYLHDSRTGQLTDMSIVFEIFRTNKNNTFFPVVNGHDEPIGLIKERDLKEFVYSRYGKDLLLNKAAGKTLLDFIAKCSIAEINMKVEKILEYFSMDEFSEGVLLTENGIYIGFLSARSLLKVLNEKNIAVARDQNPLTKLPGNTLINEFIEQALRDREKRYIIVYFDFDYFKAFNDKYGFRQGDRAILLFSDILKITSTGNRFFAGHIGGDDFFAGFIIEEENILQTNNLIENIINKFANDVISLYDLEHREKGYIISTDREGNIKQFPFMTVSAAIINIPAEEINMTAEGLSHAIADLKKSAKHSETGMAFMTLDSEDKLITGIKKEEKHKILALYR
jgi:diguanylate cyclase (GGDEF)-like protein